MPGMTHPPSYAGCSVNGNVREQIQCITQCYAWPNIPGCLRPGKPPANSPFEAVDPLPIMLFIPNWTWVLGMVRLHALLFSPWPIPLSGSYDLPLWPFHLWVLHTVSSDSSNLYSAGVLPDVVATKIKKEYTWGSIAGPFNIFPISQTLSLTLGSSTPRKCPESID